MPKIFLTGSTGYLGGKFIELYGSKYEIFGVSSSDKQHPIDLLDASKVGEAFNAFQPDFVIHTAADTGRDVTTSNTIITTNPAITKTLVDLAIPNKTPFIFTGTEAIYGGKEDTGGYIETDEHKPRSPYGESKVASEKIVKESGLPYLITRGHRHVGINKNFHKPKWFPDTISELSKGHIVHLDSHKIFNPVLINNICDIFDYYIERDSDKQIVLNMGVDKATTYYDFIMDVAKTLSFDTSLIKNDGDEAGWTNDGHVSVKKLRELGYPYASYEDILSIIKADSVKAGLIIDK